MIIRKPKAKQGVCFAWKWKWTDEGLVWLEWVHYQETDDAYDLDPYRYKRAEFGARGVVRFARYVPKDRYDAGERAQAKWRPHPGPQAEFFNGPDVKYDGVRPGGTGSGSKADPFVYDAASVDCDRTKATCTYPRCTCGNVGGSVCPADPDLQAFILKARKR